MSDNRLIDWSVARQTVQGDEELLRELVTTFLDEMPATMKAIRSSIEASDVATLKRSAHTLKGALGHFGAQKAYELAFQVETCGGQGDVAGALAALPSLDQAIAELTPVLVDYVRGSGVGRGE
jgi:HPt (histidine-containing phosphotransfer) domain-containing protein